MLGNLSNPIDQFTINFDTCQMRIKAKLAYMV